MRGLDYETLDTEDCSNSTLTQKRKTSWSNLKRKIIWLHIAYLSGDAGVGKNVLAALIICYKIYEIRGWKALSNLSDAPIHCREIMERPYIRNILMDMVGSMPCLRDDYNSFTPVFS